MTSKALWRKQKATALVVGLGLLLAGCGPDVDRGAGIYAQRCLPCHGTEGAGDGNRAAFLPGGVPDLRVSTLSDEEFQQVVRKGKKLMPAFGAALDETELRDVLTFIKRFRGQ